MALTRRWRSHRASVGARERRGFRDARVVDEDVDRARARRRRRRRRGRPRPDPSRRARRPAPRPPAARIRDRRRAARGSGRPTATASPSGPAPVAIARPRPRPPPVTSATLTERRPHVMVLSGERHGPPHGLSTQNRKKQRPVSRSRWDCSGTACAGPASRGRQAARGPAQPASTTSSDEEQTGRVGSRSSAPFYRPSLARREGVYSDAMPRAFVADARSPTPSSGCGRA